MDLMVESINDETQTLIEKQISLKVIGDLSRLSVNVRNRLFETMSVTSGGTRMKLIVALSYSSRWEISEACRRIAVAVKEERTQHRRHNRGDHKRQPRDSGFT